MSEYKNKIGLMLASIHTGSALNVWSSFARKSKIENLTLFIFPGGRLDSPVDSEYLRNSIYSLANSLNIDGLISWSSTIGYTVSKQAFDYFHESFDLPYVTISYKVNQHPCISFDAYTGMKELVKYFITQHKSKKIAFIRGPSTHDSAVDRYHGYCDALKELHIRYDEKLVTDCFNWTSGEAGAIQLLETRKLIPGKDFDTLIGSSDMMILSAIHYLEKHGYSAHENYHVGGFNNSVESKILPSQISTVHIPYLELSEESFKIIQILLNNSHKINKKSIKDVVLPCDIIIRESCDCKNNVLFDCNDIYQQSDNPIDKQKAIDSIIIVICKYLKLTQSDCNAFIVPVLDAFFYQEQNVFFNLLKIILIRFLNSNYDIEILLNILSDIYSLGFISYKKLLNIQSFIFNIITKTQEQLYINTQYQTQKRQTALNSLKCDLLCTHDKKYLIESLARHLPKIGITTACVVLYKDEKISVCIGNFSQEGINISSEYFFPSKQMLPLELKHQYEDGVFMVQPLFIENQSLGYFIHAVPFYDGVILEELRSSVSNALKGIALFEEALRAKQIAEQAQRTKTEFFSILGNDLYDPLSEIMNKIEQLEKNITVLQSNPEIILEQIMFLKSCVNSQQVQTNRLIDLTLSQIDELSFKKTLFNIDSLLPEIGTFPLLSGDTVRLSQAFTLITEECGSVQCAKIQHNGLEIIFGNSYVLDIEIWKKHTMLLAERIILMHNGEFHKELTGCRIILPWITLTGENYIKQIVGQQSHILSFSNPSLLPQEFLKYHIVVDVEKACAISGRTLCIVWDTDTSTIQDYINVVSLKNHSELFHVPFLCYSRTLCGETLIDAIQSVIQSKKQGKVLFVGIENNIFKSWADEDSALYIPSMADFVDTISKLTPNLIVLHSIDIESIQNIRKHPVTIMVPIIIVPDTIENASDIIAVCQFSHIVLCNKGVAQSDEFVLRVKAIIAGDEILPSHTGALVKKAILYFNQNVQSHISRWKLADCVNVSEDYLTRIFHREMGFPLWDYLNRYRMCIASDLLLHTNNTIYEIAMSIGFQDQAYFCRVFKKIYGIPPGQLRKK